MKYFLLLAVVVVSAAIFVLSSTSCSLSAASTNGAVAVPSDQALTEPAGTPSGSDEVFDGKKLVRSEAEWKKLLTPAEYYILREEGTDPPYQSQYHDNKEHGDYYCAACHLKLFSSKTKYDSETGWPSFYQPVNKTNVVEKVDRSLGETRTEIECARCGGHLGHVFDDGPEPTGLRYCMNGTALKFEKK
ncbi:MAG: peptide-methionine (R)-S-oxide reductase MsrB [Pyrinomonadaceae bacterium]